MGREGLSEKETEGFLVKRLNLAKLSFGLGSKNGFKKENRSLHGGKKMLNLAKLSTGLRSKDGAS